MNSNLHMFQTVKDNILYIINDSDKLHLNSVTLEGIVLAHLAFLGLLKGCTVKKVLEHWKSYCFYVFKSDQYILSELPPDYVIPTLDNENCLDTIGLNLAKKETFAWLSMSYVDYLIAKRTTTKDASTSSSEEVMVFEEEFLKMIN